MRLFLIIFILLPIFTSQAQESTCWECLIAARNLDPQISLERCTQIDKRQKLKKNEKEIISFVIARLWLDQEKSETALKYLNVSVKSDDSLLRSLSNGLLGDCYLEQNKLDLALVHYSKAADLSDNAFFTPYFLHKQGIVFHIQGKYADLERIGSRLRVLHRPYFDQMNLLMFYGNQPSVYDSVHRLLSDNRLPEGPYGIGLVNGEKVNFQVFSNHLEQKQSQYKDYPSFNMVPPSAEELCNFAWEETAISMILQSKESAFALGVDEKEFHAYLFGENGYNLLPDIENNFANEEGVFVAAMLEETLLSREREKDPVFKAQWKESMKMLKQAVAKEKYMFLLTSGLNVTTQETMLNYQLSQKVYKVKGVHFPPDYFSDSLFSFSEGELKTYFQAHKPDFDLDYTAVRKLKYFTVPIASSKKDSLAFLENLNKLKIEFQQTKADSLFVFQHSDFKDFSTKFSTYLPESHEHSREYFTYPDELDNEMRSAKPGDVIGPYADSGKFRLAKVIGFNEKQFTARHILIRSQQEDGEEMHEEKRKLANDIAAEVTRDNFEEYVLRYSEDFGSKDDGGIYSDFFDYEMVAPFSDYAIHAPIGKIGVVETDFGFHITEVLERKQVKFPMLAMVEQKLIPNEKIQQSVSSAASQLHASMSKDFETLSPNQKEHYFDSVADLSGGSKLIVIDEYSPSITGFSLQETNEQMLRNAYRKNIQPNQLFAAVNDSSAWVFYVFLNAFSGENYAYKQVESIIEADFLSLKKGDSIRSMYGKTSSLEAMAKETKLESFESEISWNAEFINEWYIPGFSSFLLHQNQSLTGIHWYHSNGSSLAYQIISEMDVEPLSDYSELKRNLKFSLQTQLGNLIRVNTSIGLKTIYNYPLLKLGVRE